MHWEQGSWLDGMLIVLLLLSLPVFTPYPPVDPVLKKILR
jgi:hypothetical protein